MLESKTLSIFHYLEQHEKAYLELENVICAGSSDFVSKDMLATGEWEDIVLNIQNIKKDLI